MNQLLLGTGNAHKVAELRGLLAGVPYVLVDLSQLPPMTEPEETGVTFRENALIKARAYANATGMLALADDSGLEIDALGGEPGVYSARWVGRETSYPERFRLIEQRLAGVPPEERTARFRCVIVIAAPTRVEPLVVAEGAVEGVIAPQPRGTNGFGYDPIFLLPDLGQTMAELPPERKAALSHRARATRVARERLEALGPHTSAE